MKFLRAVRALGPIDLKSLARDGLLIMLLILPVAVALLYRYGAGPVGVWFLETYGVRLEPYYPLLMSMLVVTPVNLIGVLIGFMLLDERDEHTLTGLMVTPLPFTTYLLYRLSLPCLLGFVMILITFPIAGLTTLPLGDLMAVSAVAMLTAPITVMFLGAFAGNKVAGLVVQKLLGAIQILPVLAFFVEEPIQYAFGIVPTYWPLKMMWNAAEGEPYLTIGLVGLALNLLFLLWLTMLFHRKQQRVM